MGETADWKGVGNSLKVLGDTLSAHLTEGGEKVKSASNTAGPGAVDQAKAGGKAAIDKLDETSRDPEVASAVKDVTNKFLDAVKVSLTGGDTPTPDKPADPEPPRAVEPTAE